jgi:hypothetical protein
MSSAYAAFPAGGPPPRRKVEYASGVTVAPGVIATSREALEGCYVVTIAGLGGADRLAEDKDKGIVLLRVYANEMKPVALSADAAKVSDVTLVGVPDPQAQGGGRAVAAVKVRLGDTLALEPAPALGFDGAAVIDAQGKLAGLAALKVPQVAGVGSMTAALTPADALRGLLAAQKVEMGDAVSGLDAAKRSVVRLICVRR